MMTQLETLSVGEGAAWIECAVGNTYDAHSLAENTLKYYLCYSHISTIQHHTKGVRVHQISVFTCAP